MENGNLKVWLPTLRTGTGSAVFTQRMSTALEDAGLLAKISWYPHLFEICPSLLRHTEPPAGTDIVLANSWNGFAFKRPKIPLVITVHHAAFDTRAQRYQSRLQLSYRHWLIQPYEMRSLQDASVITAVSRFAADTIGCATGRTDIRVIPNWVDTHRFCPKENMTNTRRPFRLLYVGKPSAIKGSDLLLPIMQQLGPNFELILAGRWPNRPLPENVHQIGWLDEATLIEQYQKCDALLFPSRFEGFGYAALEAMSCAKPVVASDSSALPELVEDGKTGLLCPMDNIDAFVDACRTLADHPDLAAHLGAAGRERAIKTFSKEAVVPHYLKLFRDIAQAA